MLFRSLVFTALWVGLATGLLLTLVQRWEVVPIIETAERYEQARLPVEETPAINQEQGNQPQVTSGHEHGSHAWEPAPGLERTFFTALSNVLMAIGYALLLLCLMALAVRLPFAAASSRDRQNWWVQGLLWGLAGYAVFFIAPSIGLPPEIPGTVSAPLPARQQWWLLAVFSTAVGLGLLVFGRSPWRWSGLAFLPLPYLVGVPQSGMDPFVGFPPEVAMEMHTLWKRFVLATAVSNAVFWLVLGILSGWSFRRFILKSID
jgi:cobalt transporter subunit CbtA